MKILYFERAPNPKRLRLFLAEKGIEVDIEQVDNTSEAVRRSDYYEPSLPGHFPVLELDDGSHLTESVAICRYFERIHPDPSLFGAEPLEEARIEMWNRRIELGLFRHVGDYFSHTAATFRDRVQIPAFAASAKASALTQLDMLNRSLSERPCIAGQAFSIADITAYVAIDLGSPSIFEIGAELSHVQRWYDETGSRASFRSLYTNW